MKKHVRLTVSGKVQGVWFRGSAKDEAERFGVCGFAMNCGDGSVCIEVEGEVQAVDMFVQWCHTGPEHALVDTVIVQDEPLKGYTSFGIKRMDPE